MTSRTTTKVGIFGAVAVGIIGISTLVLAFSTFEQRLKAPFGLSNPALLTDQNFSLTPGGATPEALLSATKDTDRDGLPDLQELEVYKTSPFLEDTDSDGILDKAEVEAGQDPTCPKGIDCRALAFPSAREAERVKVTQGLYNATGIQKLVEQGIPGLTDAASIRNFLRVAGLPADVLAQFDDATLLQIVRSAQAPPVTPLPNRVGADEPERIALPVQPAPEAVRQLLITGGADPKVVDKLTDAQLLQLYQETLQEVRAQQ